MVSVSLDTNVLIDLLRHRDLAVMRHFSRVALAGPPMIVSALVIHELETGLASSPLEARRRVQLASLLDQCSVVDFTTDDSRVSGRLRSDLRRLGEPIGEIDTLIAGQALAQGWTVVTRNIRHFGRVQGLRLIDWSVSAEPLTVEDIALRVAVP